MIEKEEDLPLFRETAVEAFARRSYGRPIAKMPRTWLYFSFMLIAMVATVSWFLVTSTYSRKEAAVGWLAPKEGLARISVSQGGLVEDVLIEQGDFVKKDAPLFVISQDRKLIEGLGTSAELLERLQRERIEIQNQITIELKSKRTDIESASILADQLKLEKHEIDEQIKEQQFRVDIQKEIFDRFDRLHKTDEAVSYLEVQAQKERYSAQKQGLAALRQRRATLGREIINSQTIISKRPLDSERIRSELQRRLIEISNRETEVKTIAGQAILSPISGSIATLEIQKGNTIYPRQLLASILPEDAPLYAEIFIPSRAIGFIKPMQPVRLMYAAYPHQRFGAAQGVVLEVSNTVLRPEEIPSSIGLEEPAYKALVALEKQSIEGFGEVLSLRPGMALSAEIILEERSFLEWILEPLRAKRSG